MLTNKQKIEFFLAGLGALIGALLALKLNFWLFPIGLIAGGGLIYVLYDPKEVVARLKPAWDKYTATFHENKEFWRLEFKAVPYFFAATATPFICAALLVCLLNIFLSIFGLGFTIASLIGLVTPTLLVWLIICLLITLLAFTMDYSYSEKSVTRGQRLLDEMKALYNRYSLKAVAIWALPHIWTAIVFCGVTVTYYALTYSEITWNNRAKIRQHAVDIFVKIHSDNRLLCVVTAVIGAFVGWLTSSVIIGAVVGIAVFAFSRRIVAKEWLKLD